jgi:hypothetical protein
MATRTATEQGRRTADLPPELFIHWIHSREEDQDDIQFFRTEGFSFPPSFGRDGMELRPDGTFIQDDVGPADGIVQTPGRWTLQGPGRIAVRFDGAREDYAFTLVSVSAELLQIRPAASATPYPSVPCADAEQMERFTSAPPATGFRLLDFDYADVVTLESFPPQFVLRVSGTKPLANMQVQLVPLVFIRQPEYWGIEVVGSLPGGIGLPALAPYEVSLPLAGFLGTEGIEVIGASRVQRFDIDPSGIVSEGEERGGGDPSS